MAERKTSNLKVGGSILASRCFRRIRSGQLFPHLRPMKPVEPVRTKSYMFRAHNIGG